MTNRRGRPDLAAQVFLRACGATRPQDWMPLRETLAALGSRDWEAVSDYSVQHGLAGLVARSLAWAEAACGLRAPIRERLDDLRRAQRMRNLVRKASARRIADALQGAGIPFIAFKGVVLAEEIYGDLSLRDFSDFDAMVPEERLEEAFDIAVALGYRLTSLGDVREHVTTGMHAASMEHTDGTFLDLHWNIAPDMGPGIARSVWRHCQPAPRDAALPGLRLTPAMTVVHLAKHLQMNKYRLLRPLVDFHVASMRFGIAADDMNVAAAAKDMGFSGIVDIAFALQERMLLTDDQCRGIRSRSPTSRIALAFVTNRSLIDSPRESRLVSWIRFLAASGDFRTSVHSLREILLPRRAELVRSFRRPFAVGMYPRYYWRQFVKVVTLSAREPDNRPVAASLNPAGAYQRTVRALAGRGLRTGARAHGKVVAAESETRERR